MVRATTVIYRRSDHRNGLPHAVSDESIASRAETETPGEIATVPDLLERLGVRRVIDLAGTETVNGAAPVPDTITRAVAEVLGERLDMLELQAAASRVIAQVTGSEAGCICGCAAAGITISVAACMTGCDMARVEQLPDTAGMKNEVILQKGHNTNFGAGVAQMIRLAGAKVVEIGTATDCALYQLRAALNSASAAAVYVVSHHVVQSGLVPLREFCAACHEAGVPVIVDAAAERDGGQYHACGADLVLVSGHKLLAAPTSGLIMGGTDLVRACLFQERGIGRPMKVGKEGIVGVIAALERWAQLDHRQLTVEHARLADLAIAQINGIRGLVATREPDPTGQPFARVRVSVDPGKTGTTAYELTRALSSGNPKIVFRTLHVDRGYFLGDFRQVDETTLHYVCDRIREVVARAPESVPALAPPQRGDVAVQALHTWPWGPAVR